MTETLEHDCRRLEHFETPEWAVRAILNKELLTYRVIDPCAGSGILVRAALEQDYDVHCCDIHDWRKPGHIDFSLDYVGDYLTAPEDFSARIEGASVLMNPPFSLAEKFVEKSFACGARKVICFQRFAWWESRKRREFWQKYTPNRIYICGDRADCWRHDIPKDKRGSSTPTAHAWFIWENAHPAGTLLGHIYKGDAA